MLRVLLRVVVVLLALVGALAVTAAAWLAAGGISARATPGRAETVVARRLRAVAIPRAAREGHDHRIMGTVSVIHENGFEVSEIKVGDRVVVTAMTEKDAAGKETPVAKEVRLANRPKR